MKKLIAMSVTLLLLMSSLAGCGKKEEATDIPENYLYTELHPGGVVEYITGDPELEETTIPEPTVVDAFDKVAYFVYNTEANVYPDDLSIQLDIENAPFVGYMTYELNIISAGVDKIVLEAVAETEDIQDFLTEKNYIVEEETKIFEINVSELSTYFLSDAYLTEENREALLKGMQQLLMEEIADENNSNQGVENFGNNPENQIATSSTLSEDVTLAELYACMPRSEVEYVDENRTNVSFYAPFIEKGGSATMWSKENCEVYRLYALYQTDGAYYLVYSVPVFNAGVLDETATTYGIMKYDDPDNILSSSTLLFPDEAAARTEIEEYIGRNNMTESVSLERIPLS